MLEAQKSFGGAPYVAVVGEEITLEVDLYNPLAMQVQVDHLRVSSRCSTSSDLQVNLSMNYDW